MNQEKNQQAFEAFAQTRLQAAFEFVDASPDVSDIWIYTTMNQNGNMCVPVYRVDGKISTAQDVDKYLPEPVDAIPKLRGMYRDFLDAVSDYHASFDGDPDARPTRLIIHYRVKTEEMNADFQYSKLANSEALTGQEVLTEWVEHLVETGDDSA